MNDPNTLLILILRELTDIKARTLTNQMLCERILELVGEDDAASIQVTVSKIHADATLLATKETAQRLREAFPNLPSDLWKKAGLN
jgi:hypothetical protein